MDHAECVWSADLWTLDAVDWITAHKNGPWFLYLACECSSRLGLWLLPTLTRPWLRTDTAPHAGSVGSVGENDVPVPRVSSGPYADRSD